MQLIVALLLYKYIVIISDGPIVDPTMKLFLLTSRDTESNLNFTLKFNVSNGVPSRLSCSNGNSALFYYASTSRGPEASILSREVIRSHYINSSYPDMTRVSITVTRPRTPVTYTCTVHVEGRDNPENAATYDFRQMGSADITASITGECIELLDSTLAAHHHN